MSARIVAASNSKLDIHWAALFKVAGVSLAFGVGVVVVFAVGVLALSQVETAREGGRDPRSGYAMAGVAFLICAAALGYGLYLIIPQFH
ncbi:MAG TPA: hypothetical protein VGL21_18795 [Jatrophihabitantaceae bacterium]|jgi:hypothetical protein